MPRPSSKTNVHCVAEGVELFTARFHGHRFPRHFHGWHVIQVPEKGRAHGRTEATRYDAMQGSVVFCNPGEVHGGSCTGRLHYRAFYLSPAALAEIAPAFVRQGLRFRGPVCRMPRLAARLLRCHRRLERDRCGAELAELERLVAEACRRAGSCSPPPAGDAQLHFVLAALREAEAAPSIERLAGRVGLGPNQLTRRVAATVGMPPYEYFTNHRLERARTLLRGGLSPSRTAFDLGFSDQSHLGRQFVRYYGVTPGRYRRAAASRSTPAMR